MNTYQVTNPETGDVIFETKDRAELWPWCDRNGLLEPMFPGSQFRKLRAPWRFKSFRKARFDV